MIRLLGWLFGMLAGVAAVAKFLLSSSAEPHSQEIDLVTIFAGQELNSVASPFYGGAITTAFGGTVLDVREAEPAPTGVDLEATVVCGGVSILVPDGWRAEFNGQTIMAGYRDLTRTDADPDAPVVRIRGLVVMGGLEIKAVGKTGDS